MIDARTLLQAYHNALNNFEFETVEQCFAQDAEYHSSGIDGALSGRSAIMMAFQKYFTEYPDQIAVDEEIEIIGPLKVKTLWRLKATSVLTGKLVTRKGSEEITFDTQGQIKRVVVLDL